MSFDKDKAIIAQNSATGAATIYASELNNAGGTFDQERYEEIRQAIFQGSLALAGAEAIVTRFESPDVPVAAGDVASAPIGGKPHNDFVVNFGKHRGKTLSAIFDDDSGWLDWAAQNCNNDYARKRIVEFLAA